jgi:YidC/Oxa1 family membrane protein insertase
VLYTIFVYPFELLIGFLFRSLYNFSGNYGVSLILLSVAVSTLLVPFAHIAEKLQRRERDIQKRMKPKMDEYRSVFKGYELHLYITNLYRYHHYHPLYALRGLIGLFIQLPFFLGAYAFLTKYTGINGVSFLFLSDLGSPDRLIQLGSIEINLLPFVMTAVNLLSGYVYGVQITRSENISIVAIALVFLVILYNAPSGLLLYWTCNNLYNLGKNILYRQIVLPRSVTA